VIRADIHLLAQRAPGDAVRFAATTPCLARDALRVQASELQAAEIESDDVVTWASIRWA